MRSLDRFPWIPFLIVGGVIAGVHKSALFASTFWAEDGTLFFSQALALGWKSLFLPAVGYALFLPRLLAFGLTFFPLEWAPRLYSLVSLGIDTMILGYFTTGGFGGCLLSRAERLAVCLLVAIGPGTAEILGNFANLHWLFGLWGALLLLERPKPLEGWRLPLFLFLVPSSPELLFFFPLLVWEAWLSRSPRVTIAGAAVALMAVVNTFTATRFAEQTHIAAHGLTTRLPSLFLAHGFLRGMVAPFLGPNIRRLMTAPSPVFWALCLSSWGIALWSLRKARPGRERLVAWVLAGGGAFLAFGLPMVYRLGLYPLLDRSGGSLLWASRYSFPLGAFAAFLWGTLLLRPAQNRRFVGCALVLLIAWQASKQSRPAPQVSAVWPQQAAEIRDALRRRDRGENKEQVKLGPYPIAPAPFQMTIILPPRAG